MNTQHPNRGRSLAKIGAFLQLGPLIGLAATGIGMIHSFNTLERANATDPRELAGKVDEVLIFTAIGCTIGLIGLAIIFTALFTTPYRSRWIFWLLLIEGMLLLFAFPVGTVLSVLICLYWSDSQGRIFSVSRDLTLSQVVTTILDLNGPAKRLD